MTPEEFIRQNVSIGAASMAHMLDSNFVRHLMHSYANHCIDEYKKQNMVGKFTPNLSEQLKEVLG